MICVPCGLQMRVVKNGALAELMIDGGGYQIFATDIYRCEGCGTQAAVPAKSPVSEHYKPDYQRWSEHVTADKHGFRYWETLQAKLAESPC